MDTSCKNVVEGLLFEILYTDYLFLMADRKLKSLIENLIEIESEIE